jgi:hypothetical protein
MAYAIITNGIVTNMIEADADYAASIGAVEADGAGIGYSYDGEAFTAPEPDLAQIAAQARATAKIARALAVDAIQVTTQAGNTFDGDELSQGRMSRAIIALSTGLAPSVTWVLADNSTIQATSAELTEALVLAGMAQAAIWVIE